MSIATPYAWVLAVPILLSSEAQPPVSSSTSFLCIEVLHDDGTHGRGSVDEDWRIVVQVEVPAAERPLRLQHFIPRTSEAEGIAGSLLAFLETSGVPATLLEAAPGSSAEERHDEWIELGAGYTFIGVRTERRNDDGWEVSDEQLRTSLRCQGERSNPGEPLSELRNFSLELREFSGANLTLTLELRGRDGFGGRVRSFHEISYPLRDGPTHRLVGLGDVLKRMGMTVTYPSERKLRASIPRDGPRYTSVRFGARQTSDASSPDRYAVDFSLRAY